MASILSWPQCVKNKCQLIPWVNHSDNMTTTKPSGIQPCTYWSGHETVAVLLPGFAINCQETVAVLLPGFAINWWQNQVTRQPQFRDLTHILQNRHLMFNMINIILMFFLYQHPTFRNHTHVNKPEPAWFHFNWMLPPCSWEKPNAINTHNWSGFSYFSDQNTLWFYLSKIFTTYIQPSQASNASVRSHLCAIIFCYNLLL